MTAQELRDKLHANPDLIRRNPHLSPRQVAELEHRHADEPVATAPTLDCHPTRFAVRITSVRNRLLDPDNISAKALVDALRYSRILPGDAPNQIDLQVWQRKCDEGEEEHTEIVIKPL